MDEADIVDSDALALYALSRKSLAKAKIKTTQESDDYTQGLPRNIHNALIRASVYHSPRLDFRDPEDHSRLSKEKVRDAVMDGTIWDVRLIGAKSVMTLCLWLEEE
jgi:hypothetical protein